MKLLCGVLVVILTHLVTCFPGIECGLIFFFFTWETPVQGLQGELLHE